MTEDIPEDYVNLVTDTFEGEVRQTNNAYPEDRSVRFDWERIHHVAPDIAEGLLLNPRNTRKKLSKAVHAWDEVSMPEVAVRIHNIPDDRIYRVGKLRTRHLGTAIGVTGEVAEIDPVKPLATLAVFECRRCGTLNRVPQQYGPMMRPVECMGCEKSGKKSNWLFQRAQSELKDVREVELKRVDTNLDGDTVILKIRLKEDLVDRLGPGDEVSLVGRYDSGAFQNSSVLSTYLDVWAIENHEEGVLMDELPPGELQEMVVDEVRVQQEDDASDFGASRADVLDAIEDEGIRRSEVETALDEAIEEGDVDEIAGEKLMVAE
ncbi:minichromosome maintenance protein MCM [Haloarcula amylovorans]|uniref:minichromosome maintenance protein MCM n=1 Tax=Haloarcula amylovorans TaxID=2562280 RepID=UPI001076350F|nr:minichromosome maintenance protein MCM [Halomicroarcula amylolytica]